MKTLQQARQFVQGKLSVLVNAPVHEYKRVVQTKEDLLNVAGIPQDGDIHKIHFWQMSRTASSNDSDTAEGVVDVTFKRTYRLEIEGYYGIDDSQATDLTFQDLIETIQDSFDLDPTLGDNADYALPMVVQSVASGFYGSVGVHHCIIILDLVMKRDRR